MIERVVSRMASRRRRRGIQTGAEIGEFIELDSHADTSVIGNNCRVISYTDKTCQVAPYHPDYDSMQDVPIVQAGTAYDNPDTGETLILIINQGLYFGEGLPVSLLNPNQMRFNGVEVDDIPKHLARDPSKATHSIYFPEHDIRIPLTMRGVISCLPVRKPTVQEVESCRWINLTSVQIGIRIPTTSQRTKRRHRRMNSSYQMMCGMSIGQRPLPMTRPTPWEQHAYRVNRNYYPES
jgi:hypothetical protein